MKRSKVTYNGAKRLFTATADKIHPLNLRTHWRGGIRL